MRIRSSSIHFGRQRLHRLAALILAVSLALQALLPISAFAYTNTVDTSSMPIGAVSDHIRKVSEMYMIAACFRYAKINNTSPDQNIEKGDIFYSGANSSTTASLGAYLTGKQGTTTSDWTGSDSKLSSQLSNCDHGQNWLKPIANDLGYTGQDWAVQVACAASFYRWTSNDQSKGLYGDACLNAPATYNFYQANDQNKNAQDFIKATSAKIGGATLTPAEQYLYNVNTLLIGCGGTDSGNPVDTTKTDTLYAQQQRQITEGTGAGITIISGSGSSAKTINEFYTFGASAQHPTGSKSNATVQVTNLSLTTYGMETGADESKIPVACSDLLANTNKYAPAYLRAITNGQLQNQTQQTRCTSSDSSTNCSTGGDTSSCQISGIGWIVCPVMSFLGDLNDKAYGVLSNFLTIKPSLITNKNLVASWSSFRDLANIAFVIAFILIIYSQITGAGITNYGIKKMLPKIIVAAVLVNVSLYVCQIAVDISNIVGSSLYELLKGFATGNSAGGSSMPTWAGITAAILGGAAVSIGLFLIVILAPTALIAVGAGVLVLFARQALIVLLIVISPLAFVAYLLPNTGSWFKRWWKMFSTLLLLYPTVAVVFGMSTLAARIVNSTGGNASSGWTDTSANFMQIMALGIMAIPLFAVPVLLKGALAAAGSIGTIATKLQNSANRRAMSSVKNSRLGEMKAAHDARKQQNRVNTRLGEGRMTRAGKFLERRGLKGVGSRLQQYDVAQIGAAVDKSRLGRRLGGDRGAAGAVFEQNKLNNEAVERSMALLENDAPDKVIGNARAQLEAANNTGDVIGARAAARVLATKTGSRGIDQLHEALESMEDSNGDLHSNIDANVRAEVNGAGLKGKDRSLDRWSRKEETTTTSGTKGRNLGSHDNSLETSRGLNESELAGHSTTQLRKMPIDKASAQRVLDAHAKGTVYLDDAKLAIFQNAAK